MRIIDAHAHLYDEPGYVDELLQTMDDCGIDKCCLSGLGRAFGFGDDEDVRRAFQAHPDRIIPAVLVRPGVDSPGKIDRAVQQGFRMIKVTRPRSGYDDPSRFPLWRRAAKHCVPILFHTGLIATPPRAAQETVSSWDMHPIRVEPIVNSFPDLNVILAHLGVCWNAEAAELARMRPNVYVDLTGAPAGWRARADAEGMEKYLWWPGAFEKVIFGTDVHCRDMKRVLQEDRKRMERLGLPAETRQRIWSGNILRLLGEAAA